MATAAPILSIRLVISGAELVLGPGEHILGRAAECAVCVEDPLASRRHAAIYVTPESVTIRDLGSRNGVLVNGEEIDQDRVLVEGDLITLGSQALTVLAVCRAGREGAPPTGPIDLGAGLPARQALAKIAVQKRAVREDVLRAQQCLGDALTSGNTTLSHMSPIGMPAGAFRLIAEAAMRAIATNRPQRAEKILETPLLEVLATLRAGLEVESEIIDLAVQQALALCEITRQTRWASYVQDLYDQMRIPMPLPVADRLALTVQRMK